ncbi:MAG: ABC transporter permease [Kosmotogaceae bacterium]
MLINALVVAIAVAIVFIIISMLKNKIAFKIGFRNIFRRKADTVLVIAGSLIGTALIVGSFAMNDSFQKFIYSQIEKRFGEVDIVVTATVEETNNPYIKYETIESLTSRLKGSDMVDGVMPIVAKDVIVGIPGKTRNMESGFSETVWLMGFDSEKVSSFGSKENEFDLKLQENGVIISEKLANNLDLKIGDELELMRDASLRFVFWTELPTVTVENIIKPEGVLGYQGTAMTNYGGSIITTPENARKLLGINIDDAFTELLVSNKGDYVSGAKHSSSVEQLIEENAPAGLSLKVNKIKEEQIEDVSQSNIDILFLALSFFAILAGVLLLANIYLMLAEERRTELGTLRALGYTRKKVSMVILYEGFFYSLLASMIGVTVGMGISKFLLDKFVNLFTNITSLVPIEGAGQFGQTFQMSFSFYIKPQSIFYGFFLGLIVPMAVVLYSCRRISRMNIVKAVRGIPEYFTERSKQLIKYVAIAGFIIGLLVVIASYNSSSAVGFFIGFVVAVLLFPFLFPEAFRRFLVTLSGIAAVIFTMFSNSIDIISSQSGDSLILMIAKGFTILFAGLLLVVYNLRIFEMLLTEIFKKFKESAGVFKVALAFAARNRRRTGLTIAMYALVIYIITLISIIPYSQEKNLQESRNLFFMGYDVGIVSMRSNSAGVEEYSEFDYITSSTGVRSISIGLKRASGMVSSFSAYVFDSDFGRVGLPELSNFRLIPEVDRSVNNVEDLWNYMRDNPKTVLLNGAMSTIASLEIGDKIDLYTITGNRNLPMEQHSSRDSVEVGDELGEFTIIGSVKNSNLTFLSGFMISENALPEDSLNNATTIVLVNLMGDNTEEKQTHMKDLRTVTNSNAQIPLFVDDLINIMTQTIRGMIDILRSFLYFGMIVGIVGIAIIMVKALYERRRLVGMLKAIGFTKKMVFSSFWIETSFTVLIGILLGMITGALTSQELFSSASFNGVNMAIPWDQLLGMGVIFYLISLMATFIPSYIASKMSPAKALRYFE